MIDRNFLFANTPGGAKGSAVIFTLIQTAIENTLDPFQHLTWLMDMAANMDLNRPENIQQLLPSMYRYCVLTDYYNNCRIQTKLKGLPSAGHRQQATSAA